MKIVIKSALGYIMREGCVSPKITVLEVPALIAINITNVIFLTVEEAFAKHLLLSPSAETSFEQCGSHSVKGLRFCLSPYLIGYKSTKARSQNSIDQRTQYKFAGSTTVPIDYLAVAARFCYCY